MKWVIALSAALLCCVARGEVKKIELTCVDDKATGYGTFQSHNQKVLQTKGGIWPALIGTIYLVGVSLAVAAPVGVLAAVGDGAAHSSPYSELWAGYAS